MRHVFRKDLALIFCIKILCSTVEANKSQNFVGLYQYRLVNWYRLKIPLFLVFTTADHPIFVMTLRVIYQGRQTKDLRKPV